MATLQYSVHLVMVSRITQAVVTADTTTIRDHYHGSLILVTSGGFEKGQGGHGPPL